MDGDGRIRRYYMSVMSSDVADAAMPRGKKEKVGISLGRALPYLRYVCM